MDTARMELRILRKTLELLDEQIEEIEQGPPESRNSSKAALLDVLIDILRTSTKHGEDYE